MRHVDPESDSALRHHEDFHKRLREEGQVAHVEQQDYYLVGGYEAVKDVMVDHDRFTKSYGNQLAPMEPRYALNQDPPHFSAFRSLYTRYMSPVGVKRWTNDCQEIADRLIDACDRIGQHKCGHDHDRRACCTIHHFSKLKPLRGRFDPIGHPAD